MAFTDGVARAPEGKQQQQEDEEEIPPYDNISPSIFVSADTDFTKPPPDLSSDPNELRSAALAEIDEHADAVQDNIYYMLNREKTRIRQECYRREARFPLRHHQMPGLTSAEERSFPSNGMEMDEILFIRSSCSEPKRGPYEVAPNFTHNQCLHLRMETGGGLGESPRKSAEKMMMNSVKHGVQKLDGLAHFVQGVKDAKDRELRNREAMRTASSTEVAPADRMDLS